MLKKNFWKWNTSEQQNIFKSRDASRILFPIYCRLNTSNAFSFVSLAMHVCLICFVRSLCHESVLVLTAVVYSPYTVLHTPLRVTERRFFPVSQLVSEWRVKFHTGFQTLFAIHVYILKPSVTDISTSLCCDLLQFSVNSSQIIVHWKFLQHCPFTRSLKFTHGYYKPIQSYCH